MTPTGLHRREVLSLLGTTACTIVASAHASAPADALSPSPADPHHRLVFDSPAREWIEALPVGNGRLGAMMHGLLDGERLSLNEDTLWSGQPSVGGAAADGLLEQMRDLIFAGDYPGADRLARRMQGHFSEAYLPLADLHVDLDQAGPARAIRRTLDLREATAGVEIDRDGGIERRTLFVSAPAQLVVLRIEREGAARFGASVRLDCQLRSSIRAVSPRRLILAGKAPTVCEPDYRNVPDPVRYSDRPGYGMAFAAIAEIDTDGSVPKGEGALRVENAGWLEIRLAAATGYRGPHVLPDLDPGAVEALAAAPLRRARGKPHARLLADHRRDHRALYDRSALALGGGDTARRHDGLPTDARRAADPGDPALAALLYNYGRYLLIASSRPGTRPANLQGIWNAQLRAPWSCNYTTNINVPMNYWMAETANLADCHRPLVDFAEALARNGGDTARDYYRMPGWCLHHNTDLWAMSNPVGAGEGDPNWANWPMGAPWIAQHLWEHYRFSGDLAYLRDRAWPVMRGAAEFCVGWLVRDPASGQLTTAPSISPENLFVTADGRTAAISAGCTMDIAMIRELFGNCIAAAAVLREDAAFAKVLRNLSEELPPYRIGRHGQLQEWSVDFAEQDPGHRTVSHLYPIFPGGEITPRRSPRLAAAAARSLDRREAHGGSSTGWSRAWATAIRARLGDGKACGEALERFLADHVARSLFGTHPFHPRPVFQIDANLGIAAAIAECLVQSHEDRIELFPALPPRWREGAVKGLRTRHGATVDLEWTPAGATVLLHARRGGTVTVGLPPSLRPSSGAAVAQVDLRVGRDRTARLALIAV